MFGLVNLKVKLLLLCIVINVFELLVVFDSIDVIPTLSNNWTTVCSVELLVANFMA